MENMRKLRILILSEVPLAKYGILSGFIQQGHEADFMHGEYSLICSSQKQLVRIENKIREYKPDFVFTEGFGGCNISEVAKILRRHNLPLIFWAIEDPVTTAISMYYAPYSDFIFTTTVECLGNYMNIGKPCDVLMFATNPEFHKNVESQAQFKYEIVIAASNYSNRYNRTQKFIMPLVYEDKYDMAFWGYHWDDFKRPVNLKSHMELYHGMLSYEDLPALYSTATIALGSQCDDTSITQQSMRNFEVLGCGHSILLSYYTKAQEQLFGKSGELIYLAKTTQEMIDMADEILAMKPEQRKEMANKAQKFVYENHNYKLRANQIINAFIDVGGLV